MSTETTFVKKTETWFTLIEIHSKFSFYWKDYFVATFKSGKNEESLEQQTFQGTNLNDLIERISRFLDCEITEKHYIIK